MHLATHGSMPYNPTSDVLERHEYGVAKNRKLASTGGGRAWSEDEVSRAAHRRAPQRGDGLLGPN